MVEPVRTLVLWCPDWPVVAACAADQVPAHRPAAVFAANRVVATSAVARASGVRRGQRRREAQSRCPELVVLPADPDRDARFFERVAAAVEELVVGVEVVRPGVVAVPVSGAAGYFGGEEPLIEMLVDHVSGVAGVECQVGVADGVFAAVLAAHRAVRVPPGATAAFLAPLDVRELDQPGADRGELVDLLRRLGIRTLGAFAELTERDVASRFSADGLRAHRLARGRFDRPPHRRRPPPELSLRTEFDPPLERVDAAAFAARSLAGRFHAGLAEHGLACTRLGIYAGTERGEEFARVWRCAEPLDAQGVENRVRWQFEGWLRAAEPGARPTGGVTWLRLVPDETVEGRHLQTGLWHGAGATADEERDGRAARAMVHVQGLLGPERVVTARLDGGRGPAERVRLVPWGERHQADTPANPLDRTDPAWPGRLPAPSPATVYRRPVPVGLRGESGAEVVLLGRRELSEPPRAVVLSGQPRAVRRWAGPWPDKLVRSTWQPDRVWMQLVLEGSGDEPEVALLMAADLRTEAPQCPQCPQWTIEGMYD
ncbi:DNA polymerase Y family protein [Amycolatopsis suaedae]|uniref:DNA polymerase Y family protein n=1 Tax=Amycolatopsis suaedae TaxID=2510978 RepID=UPI003B82E373